MSVGTERLRTLYAVLAGLPDSKVDLTTWRGSQNDLSDEELLGSECGYAACAVGWACAYPPFKEMGLDFDSSSHERGPVFEGQEAFSAVEKFFDLNPEQALNLFSRYRFRLDGPEPKDFFGAMNVYFTKMNQRLRVMARIRRFLFQQGVITAERNAELASQEGMLL